MANSKTKSLATPSAYELISSFNELTDTQFDFWLEALNEAVRNAEGAHVFSRDDRQKTISYWYLVGALAAEVARKVNVFAPWSLPGRWADSGLSVTELTEKLGGKYELETVRRYITDLKRFRLVEQAGRGKEAQIQFSRLAVEAYLKTLRHWIAAFGEFEEKVKRLDALLQGHK
jgi:hypothetical protein